MKKINSPWENNKITFTIAGICGGLAVLLAVILAVRSQHQKKPIELIPQPGLTSTVVVDNSEKVPIAEQETLTVEEIENTLLVIERRIENPWTNNVKEQDVCFDNTSGTYNLYNIKDGTATCIEKNINYSGSQVPVDFPDDISSYSLLNTAYSEEAPLLFLTEQKQSLFTSDGWETTWSILSSCYIDNKYIVMYLGVTDTACDVYLKKGNNDYRAIMTSNFFAISGFNGTIPEIK